MSRGPDLEKRLQVWTLLILPIGFFWLLVLFAPLSSSRSLVERIGIGCVFTVMYGPFMWVRAVRE